MQVCRPLLVHSDGRSLLCTDLLANWFCDSVVQCVVEQAYRNVCLVYCKLRDGYSSEFNASLEIFKILLIVFQSLGMANLVLGHYIYLDVN